MIRGHVAIPRRTPKTPRVPKTKRVDVTRAEFDHVIDLLNERGHILNNLRHDLDIQFKRIAAMQAEIDRLKGLTDRMAPGGVADRTAPGGLADRTAAGGSPDRTAADVLPDRKASRGTRDS
jgi:hypothetical protein